MISLRPIAWTVSLILGLIFVTAWALLPALESEPELRVFLFSGLGITMLGMVFTFPAVTGKSSIGLLVFGAILLRILLLPSPVSDDVNRYLWEGKLVSSGENPYLSTADDPRWMERRDIYWEGMNHRDRPTAYPPGIQWIMAGTASIHYHPFSFKILSVAADLLSLLLVIIILNRERFPLRWAGFYAFNPVILIAFAAEAHFDSLMIATILGALMAAKAKRLLPALFLLALAVQIKFIALILLPLFLVPDTGNAGKTIKHVATILPAFGVFLLMLIAPSIPFGDGLISWIRGTSDFAGNSAFNGPLFTFFSVLGANELLVRALCYIVFFVGFTAVCIARIRGLALAASSGIALTLLLICSPIVHFWYLAWILPFAALRPSFGWTTASITMAVYFLAWRTQAVHGWWGFQPEVSLFIWIPVFCAFLAQNRHLPARIAYFLKTGRQSKARNDLGIVIPVIAQGARSEALVERLGNELPAGTQIIIADASQQLGRGNQIAAGISKLDTDWVLVAHADTISAQGWYQNLMLAIEAHPEAALMVLGQRFDKVSPGTLLVEILNELRVVFGGVAFGDQTMVIRRSALDSLGGFPAQPLMEDVEASLQLDKRGPILYLGHEWSVSAVKWNDNFGLRFLTVIRLVATYQFTRLKGPTEAAKCAEKLYTQYYK
ncbi:glycosyltransferase [Luteolibacter algae]|uniref:Glycosyltransferase n=1 Tax=Luteolibacter algae TaxID=454151 RepID=A0ABW5D8D4_9BACT